MSADTKGCGCLCKQGTAARRKDQRWDIYPKPQTFPTRAEGKLWCLHQTTGSSRAPRAAPKGVQGRKVSHHPPVPFLMACGGHWAGSGAMGQSGGAAEPSTRQEAAGLCVFSLLAHEGGRGGGSKGQGRWDRLQGRGEVDRGDNQQIKCLLFCRYNHSSENNWLVFFRLPPLGEAVCSSGSPSPTLTRQQGISLPMLAPPSPFVSFLHPLQYPLCWTWYCRQQSTALCRETGFQPGFLC